MKTTLITLSQHSFLPGIKDMYVQSLFSSVLILSINTVSERDYQLLIVATFNIFSPQMLSHYW